MLSWSDGHGTGADVDVVDGRCGNLPHRRRGGRGNASPLHGVGGGSAVDPRPASVGGTAPLCRGQAVPDPSARQGRQSHGAPIVPVPAKSCTWSIHATAICRTAGAAGEATPRPYTDGSARRRCDRYLQRWGRIPRPVGVRRCLTPRPATAGKPDRGRSSCRGRVIHTGTFADVHVATLPGAAPVDRSRVFLAPRAHQPVPTASPCRLLTASPLGEPRRLSG
jgi:hypothetical protein